MRTYIDHNALDQLRLDEMIHHSKLLNQYSIEGQYHFEDFTMLLKDIIYLLYKHVLIIQCPYPSTLHYELLVAMQADKHLMMLRTRTVGSLSNTYLSLKLILDGLFESIRGRDVLEEISALLETANATSLLTLQSLLTNINLQELLTDDELTLLDSLASRLNSAYGLTLSPDNIMACLINHMHNKVSDSLLDQILKQAINQLQENHDLKALINAMDKVLEEEALQEDIMEDPLESFDPKLHDSLSEKFASFLHQQYLTRGDHIQSPQFSSSLGEENETQASRFSDTQVQQGDQLVDVHAYALDQGPEEQIRGITKPNRLGKSFEFDPSYSHYRSAVNNQLKRLKLPRILKKSLEAVDHFNETTQTLGIDKNSMNNMSFDDIIQLYRRYKKPDFVRFINKVGKNKLHASILQHKKKRKHAIPVDKVTSSNKIDLLIEDELISLALDINAFENDFYDRYLRDDLLTLEMIERYDRRKGPIILCYDGSGSMEGAKIEETQSHILAIMEIAKIQKRHMVIIQFAAASEPLYIKEINPKFITAQDVMDILDTFICGGTNFEKPLSKAIEYIKMDQHKKSDILFITDGQCEIKQDFKDEFLIVKKQRDFKLYTLIMHSYTYHDYGDIGDISDEIMAIQERDFNNWNTLTNERLYSLI